jgi:shikimate dehydrogenase
LGGSLMSVQLTPATRPTLYFIGVTTGSSSIMQVFPAWAEHLGLDAVIKGIDLPLDDSPENYRAVVDFLKHDPLSLGSLVTTHKLNLYKASSDLFDRIGSDTEVLDEVSSISKRGSELCGHAMDPITCGLSLEAIVDDDHWSRTGGELLLLGAGGSSLALTLYLHRRALAGRDVPAKVVVTNRRPGRLAEMQEVHRKLDIAVPVEYHLAPTPELNDARVAALPADSVVANATGLGKDRPGSPLTNSVVFPARATAWDFNYRGDLLFLDQARAQADSSGVTVVDGWTYFIHGWTRVIAQVFDIAIPTAGPAFDELSRIALEVTSGVSR